MPESEQPTNAIEPSGLTLEQIESLRPKPTPYDLPTTPAEEAVEALKLARAIRDHKFWTDNPYCGEWFDDLIAKAIWKIEHPGEAAPYKCSVKDGCGREFWDAYAAHRHNTYRGCYNQQDLLESWRFNGGKW